MPPQTEQPPARSHAADNGDTAQLVDFLATHDAACPLCGYNLRFLTAARCPECGRELRLTVGLTEPHLRAWITLTAAECTAGGTGLFFILMVVANGWPRVWGSTLKTFFMNASLLYFMFSVPVAAAALLTRRKFVKLPSGTQWALAWVAVALTSAAMIAFAGLVN